MALNRKTLEGRIRASQVAAAPTPAPSRPRMALVPSGVMPLGARCAMVVIEASRVVDDPLAAPVSSWMFEADEPQEASWYQTRLAIQVATDLQRSTPLNIIMQIVNLAESSRINRAKQWERDVAATLAQGNQLVARMQRYSALFWNPDIRDLADTVLRIIHPDSRDGELAMAFGEENLRDLYEQALRVHAGKQRLTAGPFLRLAERVLVWRIESALARADGPDALGIDDERVVSSLEQVRWLRFVKGKQLAMSDQLDSEASWAEDPIQSNSEAFSIIASVIETIFIYREIEQDPCVVHVNTIQAYLKQIEALATTLTNVDDFPMARFKSGLVREAITELVGPVTFLAYVAHATGEGERLAEAETRRSVSSLDDARINLLRFLEYAENAARSYLEWLEARTMRKRPAVATRRFRIPPGRRP
ncbi:MAG TPA: hypothetical protein VFC51_11245 [Chloroflexota bacterium]|nr:hypothetical protein [Chloroflexota bacterium]